MNFKSLIAATAFIASSASFASTPIVLEKTAPDMYAGVFSANENTNAFIVDLSEFASLHDFSATVVASSTGFKGYDVTSVTFDGASFLPSINSANATGTKTRDYWTFDLSDVSSAFHTLVVTGINKGAASTGFSGSLAITNTPFAPMAPVPEPETFAMLLAGLGLMGAIARRRNKANA